MQLRLPKFLGVLLLLASITFTRSSAQWVQKSNGLEGGSVYSILVDGSSIFAGSRAGVFRSNNNGVSWIAVSKGLPATVEARYLAGTATNLFVGTSAGVYRSIDAGANWTNANTGLTQNIRSLMVMGNKVFAGISSGVYVSDNNGSSWIPINNGLPSNSDVRFLMHDGSTIYLAATMGVYQSVNGGASWEIVGTSIIGASRLVQKGNMLFASAGGVFKSEKVGSSWSEWTPVINGLPATTILSLSLNGNALLSGSNQGIYESTDDGASWHPINNGIPENISVFSFAVSGSNLLAGTMRGIYFSEDAGTNWTRRNQGLTNPLVSSFVENGGFLFAGTDCGVFKSANGGETWSHSIGTISGSGLYTRVLAADGTFVFAGTQNGIYRSSDNGETWELSNTGIPANQRLVNALLTHEDALFVGMLMDGSSDDEVIYKSTNNGASWTSASSGLPVGGGASALTSADGKLFAAIDGSIYNSVNDGDSWTLVKPGFGFMNFIKFDGVTLYAPLSIATLYKSQDDGVTWTQLPTTGISARTLEQVSETLFLGTNASSKVVYMSNDEGASWIPAGVGLPVTISYVLYATADKLFGGIQKDGGIWSRSLSDFTSHFHSFSPASGPAGTQVTITGNNFSDDPAANVVQFNGVTATVTASTATSITVVVPQTATTGKITVTANGQSVTSTSDFTVEEMITAVSPTYDESWLVLYPNPSSNFVNLDFGNNFNGHATLNVYSSTGKLIKVIEKSDSDNIAVDVSSFTPGLYFIEIVQKDKSHHKRFIKF